MSTLFSYAFRPLFALAILYALIAVPWWTLGWAGYLPLPRAYPPVLWHAHEMLFGFVGAAIAGFILTAVANWTGRPPVGGASLAALCLLWLAARSGGLAGTPGAQLIAAGAGPLFFALLTGLLAREVIAAGNRRNLKLIAPLALLTLAEVVFQVLNWRGDPRAGTALWFAVFVITLLISLIGGRIVPAFTANWLARRAADEGLPPPRAPPAFNRIDLLAIATTAAFAVAWLLRPQAEACGLLGLVAAAAQGLRWSRWRGRHTFASPLVWVLHVGYAWIPLGLGLLAASCFRLVGTSAGLHALTTGAFSTMILAVSARAALGHTGRSLTDHPLTSASFLLITLSAVLRVTAALRPGETAWLLLAGAAWFAAMLCFALRYLPILLGPASKPT